MELNEYQEKAMSTCMDTCCNFSYMMLNLVAEVGEFAGKVAKNIRKGKMRIGEINGKEGDIIYQIQDCDLDTEWLNINKKLEKEAGDILWQIAGLCKIMGWSLEDVAELNLAKLQARKEAGTIDGDGDGITKEERNRINKDTNTEPSVDPIPITIDILRDNGFSHFKDGNYCLDIPECWRWKECEIWINIERESVCITRKDKTHDVSWSGEGIHLNGVKYVHELQQALRLFQIDMDIKLQ